MLNNKAIVSLALIPTLILSGAEIPKPVIQKPSIKVIRKEPLIDKNISKNKLNMRKLIQPIYIKFTPKYYIKEIPLSKELQKYTYDLCKENNVDFETVLAIMWEESRFQPNKIHYNNNGTTDYGLCQINSCHSSQFKSQHITNILEPHQNIRFAISMLTDINKKYTNTHDCLMCYGLGETGMKKAKRKGRVTTKAVEIVLSKKSEYEKIVKTL